MALEVLNQKEYQSRACPAEFMLSLTPYGSCTITRRQSRRGLACESAQRTGPEVPRPDLRGSFAALGTGPH
jgi:hypothetical protein